jgi:hypothetical protein
MNRWVAVGFVGLFAVGCASGYRNVNPSAKLNAIKLEMSDKRVLETMGKPDDVANRERIGTQIAWYPMTLLILPIFFHPPYSESMYYYKGEGRVLLRTGWGGDVNLRVVRVSGDPNEDGYR